jgi:thiamine-phosphate pyrophosphorylase
MTNDADDYPCRLYLISPMQMEPGVFAPQLRAALEAGDVGAFQLRLKETPREKIADAARALQPICREYGVAFLLNDDVQLAHELDLDGVHLGQEDMGLKAAREILGEDKVIGISCHDSSHMAMEAGDNGADYVAFGAFYPTTSKSAEKLAKYGTPTADMVEWWSTYTVVPCVAIGGMTPENCAPLVEAGADFIAVINGVWNHPQGPAAAVNAFNDAIKKGLHVRKEQRLGLA